MTTNDTGCEVRSMPRARASGVPKLLTDADVCKMLHVSRHTICRRLKPSYLCRPGEVDLRLARPAIVGRKRYWVADDLGDVLRGRGMTI